MRQPRRRESDRKGARRRFRQRSGSLVLIVVVLALSVAALARSQANARDELQDRYATRAGLAASFAQTYVAQLLARESEVAVSQLATGTGAFDVIVRAFGFTNAVLLDDDGRVLAVYPARPELLGTRIADGYPHLRAAVAGTAAVSPVVPAAADGEPVVGFATPYATPSGRRVFSGAYAVSETPLASYLTTLASLRGSRVYLVDDRGVVLAAAGAVPGGQALKDREPDLARDYRVDATGTVAGTFWSAYRVRGAPWSVVAAVPNESLLAPVRGSALVLPWLLLAVLLGTVLLTWGLVFRRLEDHDRLRRANARLDLQANVDALTGIANRRSMQDRLAAACESHSRAGSWLAVLIADVDHFKRVNDTFGHQAGDTALMVVAARLKGALRDGDLLGRWGGEEFLLVLPGTPPTVAEQVAERLRRAVADEPLAVGTGGDEIDVSVSIGVAASTAPVADVLVYSADRALYQAKAAGRNRVFLIGAATP